MASRIVPTRTTVTITCWLWGAVSGYYSEAYEQGDGRFDWRYDVTEQQQKRCKDTNKATQNDSGSWKQHSICNTTCSSSSTNPMITISVADIRHTSLSDLWSRVASEAKRQVWQQEMLGVTYYWLFLSPQASFAFLFVVLWSVLALLKLQTLSTDPHSRAMVVMGSQALRTEILLV